MNKDKKNQLNDCVTYFRERSVYEKLFEKVREKYAGLGHFGGTVQLTGLGDEECVQLSGFFQKDFTGKKTVSISYGAMEKALQSSRFHELMWEDILREYFGEELHVKKAQQMAEVKKRAEFFDNILAEFSCTQQKSAENMRLLHPGVVWLEQILRTKGEGYLLLMKQYKESPRQLQRILRLFLSAVPKLPFLNTTSEKSDTYIAIAVFAAENTGDPHFFDAGTLGEQLLVAFLKVNINNSIGKTSFHVQEKSELFYAAGLLKDDLSNHTLVYGIHAMMENGAIHEGIEGFWLQHEPMILTLRTLGRLKKVYAQCQKRVYVVENPAVFAALIKNWPEETVICGNGQIRLATLALMDLFDSDVTFYYAGDFDPEGLQIAQKLKERYGKRLHLWRYQREYYEAHKSDVKISDTRLKKLDKIYLEELQEIKEGLLCDKYATYQETMLEEYLSDKM